MRNIAPKNRPLFRQPQGRGWQSVCFSYKPPRDAVRRSIPKLAALRNSSYCLPRSIHVQYTRMSLKKIQQSVDEWTGQFTPQYWQPLEIIATLTEEVGELAREVNHRFGAKRKKETEGEQRSEERRV